MAKKYFELLRCAAGYWNSDNASATGASLAFFCAFSLAPLLVIILTISGWVVGATNAYGEIGAQLNGLFGPATAKVLLDAVKSSQKTQGLLSTAISIVTLLISATTVLAALQAALQQIWGSQKLAVSGLSGWVQTRFLSLGFILTLGFLLLVSLTVSTGISNVRERIAHLHGPLVEFLAAIDFAASLIIVSALFALIYRYMPARRLPWSTVITGGFLTALLFDAGRWAVSLYLAHSTEPSAYGAAASFAALLLWLYYTAQIFLFGAEFTACLGGLRRDGQPRSDSSKRADPQTNSAALEATPDPETHPGTRRVCQDEVEIRIRRRCTRVNYRRAAESWPSGSEIVTPFVPSRG